MMKKSVLLLSIILIFVSCGDYQKMLKSEDSGAKYAMAEKFYNEGMEEGSKPKLRKALRLFEQIVPEYRGRPQGEKLTFLFADTYYQLGDYYLSSYQFERFIASYPNSEKAEEALYKGAKSYYEESPRYNLDQTDTYKATEELQKYVNTYPEGKYLAEANELITELRIKLEKKAYEIAKQYHHTRDYKEAIIAFNNFILEYPGTPFRQAAAYYRYESAYLLAINSYAYLQQERLNTAKEYYSSYKKTYPDGGEYTVELETSYQDIESRLLNL